MLMIWSLSHSLLTSVRSAQRQPFRALLICVCWLLWMEYFMQLSNFFSDSLYTR